jgi:Abnormal spindle-like microcephaly-assoc'd, ASPM-SPD-2-Hydin/Divergent InlB B-repeat domain
MPRWLGILALCVACGGSATKKPAALVADHGSVEFATTSPGETSAEASVRISNAGEQASAALATAMGGQDPGAFVVTRDGCAGLVLAPAASCEVRLAFRPSDERQFGAELRLTAGAAGANVAMTGRGVDTAQLAISKAASSFQGVELGQSASTSLTISNLGTHATSPLSFDAAGDTGSFTVGGPCIGRSLAPGDSCPLQVTFSPQTLGAKALSLTILGSRFASVRTTFDGYGKRVVVLTVSEQGDGNVAVSGSADTCSTQPCRLRFEIGGPAAKASLTATPGSRSLFAAWSGDCSGTAPSCDMTIDRDRSVVAKFVPAVILSINATSLAAGQGFVQTDSGDSCQAPCTLSRLVVRGRPVRLAAAPNTGSQFRWTGDCGGSAAICDLAANADMTVGTAFNGANYVFVTSQTYRTDLGLAGYDRVCNERARIAGLPGSYLAWLSTTTTDAVDRFSSARGFIRVDGRPFADTLQPGAPVYFPPALDEFGMASTAWPYSVMNGSDGSGRLVSGENCSDWTVSGAYPLRLGNARAGSQVWTGWGSSSCQTSWAILCFGAGIDRPLQRERASGRVAFVSWNALPSGGGVTAADSLCASEARAAGLPGSFKALLSADGASAAGRFDLRGPPWVRTDGVPIVEKAADLAGSNLIAPLDVTATGAYVGWNTTWTGARTPGDPGTSASTCSSWTSTATDVYAGWGAASSIDSQYWFGLNGVPCNGWYNVYCLQE